MPVGWKVACMQGLGMVLGHPPCKVSCKRHWHFLAVGVLDVVADVVVWCHQYAVIIVVHCGTWRKFQTSGSLWKLPDVVVSLSESSGLSGASSVVKLEVQLKMINFDTNQMRVQTLGPAHMYMPRQDLKFQHGLDDGSNFKYRQTKRLVSFFEVWTGEQM
ncbi:hypothetical protein HD554DRAFT_2253931 [Boletus coccyginus]|nr:hypothetical protein HD554DRAFT_2253931 [Boletus coccyginus]